MISETKLKIWEHQKLNNLFVAQWHISRVNDRFGQFKGRNQH